MIEEFIFLFFGWCLTSLLVNGSIFDPFKNYLLVKAPFFAKLLSCIQCTGVWIGALVFWPIIYTSKIDLIFDLGFLNYFVYPILQSGFGVLVESFVIMMVKNSSKN